jgi:hypothetical protein
MEMECKGTMNSSSAHALVFIEKLSTYMYIHNQ